MARLVRFWADAGQQKVHIGFVHDEPTDLVSDLTARHPAVWADVSIAYHEAQQRGQAWTAFVRESAIGCPDVGRLHDLQLLPPVHAPEVWAAGVTYERSKEARNSETRLAESVYDRVYDAERPEIFFKATARRVTAPGAPLQLRSDSVWMVPEPELALVLAADGGIIGYTIGNDMSSRDIEGENPLYLPQAKIFSGACSFGPALLLADDTIDPYDLEIHLRIMRASETVFAGTTSTAKLRRKFDELVAYLLRDNEIEFGTVLFTGTGIVPPDEFTLHVGDRVDVEIGSIGVLSNLIAGPKS